MRKNLTEIVFILDRSGSMSGLERDTIGGAIHHIGNVHKYARPENVPEHTMFVITTDGMENASRRYNSEKVKQMIERSNQLCPVQCPAERRLEKAYRRGLQKAWRPQAQVNVF